MPFTFYLNLILHHVFPTFPLAKFETFLFEKPYKLTYTSFEQICFTRLHSLYQFPCLYLEKFWATFCPFTLYSVIDLQRLFSMIWHNNFWKESSLLRHLKYFHFLLDTTSIIFNFADGCLYLSFFIVSILFSATYR